MVLVVSGPGKKSNRAVTMRLRSWHLLLKMDFSWVQRRRVHVRRDWGPAAEYIQLMRLLSSNYWLIKEWVDSLK